MNPTTSMAGEKRRGISFNMGNPTELELYKFSKRINLSQFVKHHLAMEYQRLKAAEKKVSE